MFLDLHINLCCRPEGLFAYLETLRNLALANSGGGAEYNTRRLEHSYPSGLWYTAPNIKIGQNLSDFPVLTGNSATVETPALSLHTKTTHQLFLSLQLPIQRLSKQKPCAWEESQQFGYLLIPLNFSCNIYCSPLIYEEYTCAFSEIPPPPSSL